MGYAGFGATKPVGFNGKGYEFSYTEEVLESVSFVTQAPAGEGIANAITINYGAGGITSDGFIQVHPNGEIEQLKSGKQHEFDIFVRLARNSAAGVAVVHVWLEVAVDGVNFAQPPDSHTITQEMDDSTSALRETGTVFTLPTATVGTKYRVRFARNQDGPDQGSLEPFIMAGDFVGLTNSPSVTISIRARVE